MQANTGSTTVQYTVKATRVLFARTLLQFHWCQVGERGSCPESAVPGSASTITVPGSY